MSTILILDDCPRDRERYSEFLGGHALVFCETGTELIASARSAATAPTLAIIRWEIESIPNGPETIDAVCRGPRQIPVLAVSGRLDLDRAATARALGASDFLLKPLDRKRLDSAVEKALTGEQPPALLADLRERLPGESPAFVQMLRSLSLLIQKQADPILLVGANGTGKELLARAVHELSPRRGRPWVAVNVASLPPTLIESELFGHEKGSYTGAEARRQGAFEQSANGTLFLDEIGELDLSLQAKLLRVLENRSFRRVGGKEDIPVASLLVFATNRELVKEVEQGRFKKDLYYRLSSFELRVPTLRERGDDVWLLADHFLRNAAQGRTVRLARETREILSQYSFPGNIRELRSLIERGVMQCQDDEVLLFHLPVTIMQERQPRSDSSVTLESMEWPEDLDRLPYHEALHEVARTFDRQYLPKKLREVNGIVARAAKAAGLDPKTFRRKWDEAGLPPTKGSEE